MTKLVAPTGKAILLLDAKEALNEIGLIIPEQLRKTSTYGTVISSGVTDVSDGDHVLLATEYVGADFDYEGVTYRTVVAEEILAVA